MGENKELIDTLKKMVARYEEVNKNKEALKYQVISEDGKIEKKNCILQAAYAYQFHNAYYDNCLNLVLVYEGWTPLLQKIAMGGIYRGNVNNLGVYISVYALNINDFDMSEDNMLLYKDMIVIMDKKGLFSGLKDENNNYKKVKTML